MNVRSWKDILLEWISECGFAESEIEQSDIMGFYQKLYQNHKYVNASLKSSVISFLKEHYPEFQPNLDDEHTISSADYIYVYSLFLHFSCVKFPTEYFLSCTRKLSEQSQESILTFFKRLRLNDTIKREHLRNAISDDGVDHLNAQVWESIGSSDSATWCSSSAGSLKDLNENTSAASQTFLTEERMHELYSLRAQLETEQYEKNLLELQIKQNEEKFLNLNHDHQNLTQYIQNFKNDTPSMIAEAHSSEQDGNIQEVLQRNVQISKLTDFLSTLTEEQKVLEEKRHYAEKKMTLCGDRIQTLICRVNEVTASLEGNIKFLSDSNKLERLISDTRLSSNTLRLEMIASAECLNTTSAQNNTSRSCTSMPCFLVEYETQQKQENSSKALRLKHCFDASSAQNNACPLSGNLSRPQSMITLNNGKYHENHNRRGSYIVDVLLQKDREIKQLREELLEIRNTNSRLSRHMRQLAGKYSAVCGINMESKAHQVEDIGDPMEHFMLFASYVDQLYRNYKNERISIKQLNEDTCFLEEKCSYLCNRVKGVDAEMSLLRENIYNIESTNDELQKHLEELQHNKDGLQRSKEDLQQNIDELEEKLTCCEKDNEMLNRQKLDLMTNFESFVQDCRILKNNFSSQDNELIGKINKLRAEFENCGVENRTLCEKNVVFAERIEVFHNKLESLENTLTEKTAEYVFALGAMSKKLEIERRETEIHLEMEQSTKAKYDKLLIKYEDMKKTVHELDAHIEVMYNDIIVKELELSKLGKQIVEVLLKNTELETRIDTILNEYRRGRKISSVTINQQNELIKKIGKENEGLKAQFVEHQSRLEDEQKYVSEKVDVIKSLLSMPFVECNLANSLDDIMDKLSGLALYQKVEEEELETADCDVLSNIVQMPFMDDQLKRELPEYKQRSSTRQDGIKTDKMQLDPSKRKVREHDIQFRTLAKKKIM